MACPHEAALAAAVVAITVACGPAEAPVQGPGPEPDDRIDLPAASREFASPDRRYVLEVELPGLPAGKRALARLYRSGELVWELPLPHEYGPRHALVDARGSVLLVDEWIHVPSRHALVLFDSAGHEVAHHSFDDVVRVLQVERRQVTAHAKLGVWLTTPPALDGEHGVVAIETSGKRLTVRLSDGHLSVDG